jgi:uncharacterized membrane protein YkoI
MKGRMAPGRSPLKTSIRQLWFAAVALGLAATGIAHPALEGVGAPATAPPAKTMRDSISMDEAVSRAERQFRARVVRAEATERDGRLVYVLRLLSDDGRVFTVRIDASSGAMM